ncbi:MAG TPA: SCO family protein [Alphaproteobacteria bacterium]|nr:SCO family protein [Alphaproteobacteria bacterium]
MTSRHGWSLGLCLVLLVVGWRVSALSHKAEEGERLSEIGPAPAFALTDQDGRRLSLMELRGKVVVVTFIYTSCADACPLLTAKMAGLQNDLGADFASKVFFTSITVDPERDTPEVLAHYAQAHGANLFGWAFLTGTPDEIRAVARQYGIYSKKHAARDVDHTFLTSLVDQHGTLRVQYVGTRFDSDELLHDVQSLLREGTER